LSRLPKDEQGLVFDKISSGKVDTYNKLRSLVNAMIYMKEQESFLPDPTPAERAVNSKYDRMIENLIYFINRSFNPDDLTVLAAVLSPVARDNINRIDMIILHLQQDQTGIAPGRQHSGGLGADWNEHLRNGNNNLREDRPHPGNLETKG